MEFNGKNYVKGKCLKIIRIISMMVMALIVKMKKNYISDGHPQIKPCSFY